MVQHLVDMNDSYLENLIFLVISLAFSSRITMRLTFDWLDVDYHKTFTSKDELNLPQLYFVISAIVIKK